MSSGFSPIPLPGDGGAPLHGGLPAAEALPVAALQDSFAQALARGSLPTDELQYGTPAGRPELREALALRERTRTGRVSVTNGGLHGLHLVTRSLVAPGDLVTAETPTYPLAAGVFRAAGARTAVVPTCAEGIDLDALSRQLRAGEVPTCVYVVPYFHNPTGVSATGEVLTELHRLAVRYGFVVVADCAYRDLAPDPTRPEAVAGSDHWVELGSFSKTLGPGLRIGWVHGPEWLVERVTAVRGVEDQHGSGVTQAAVAHLLSTPGRYDGAVTRAAALYAERTRYVARLVADSDLGAAVELDPPAGGLFLWLTFRDPAVDVLLLAELAARRGTSFTPGTDFDPTGTGHYSSSLRLGVGNQPRSELETGVRRLLQAFDDLRGVTR
ncbi:PLP-dependent aminotransferase family protein [Kytococcus sedentarius]|uniref:Transcriptional regulator with HTH domain and aminotransferase domain n=1 Tax=Kytococcus sedentarius (strain ATCC 14392 / DSM 20547 / JCM 11482 / CCUG 33030 / NBRC 15357 / NCTC 11040 / CCM 314 / 541) TaxID=478801 RepID=C7NJL4_KYTSD|nr:PLP-dependent aminotransferase family protein [Kytococcus sedentarius]ACV05344.1 transcriptional regulator with HTH domain and aminotransferase domain [Kytococcus sedentarius DSM 20547]QQB63794.1 PLP-dependent aminotransferase family protein [Kytococcus sedentarius]STX13242.1 2-aminoadipate transaminase [Kytococcus sedentarius]